MIETAEAAKKTSFQEIMALAKARKEQSFNTEATTTESAGGDLKRTADTDASFINKRMSTGESTQNGSFKANLPGFQNGLQGLGYNTSKDIIIPDNKAGLVIGKGGSVINKIMADSGARLQLAQESHDGGNSRNVTITGTQEAINMAESIVQEIVNPTPSAVSIDHFMNPNPAHMTGAPVANVAPEVTIKYAVPANRVGMVIGRGGEKIRELQDRSQAKIQLVQDSLNPLTDEKDFIVEGTSQQVEYAKQLIAEVVTPPEQQQQQSNPGMGGPSGSYQPNANSGHTSLEFQIPADMVGVVIGQRGATIKQLQYEGGARIQLAQENIGDERRVTVSGTEEQCNMTKQRVLDVISMRAGQNMQQQQGNSTMAMGCEDFPVKADKCGIILGKGGCVVKQIAQMSGAKLVLNNDPLVPGQVNRVFKISGTPTAIQSAKTIIEQKLQMYAQGIRGMPVVAGQNQVYPMMNQMNYGGMSTNPMAAGAAGYGMGGYNMNIGGMSQNQQYNMDPYSQNTNANPNLNPNTTANPYGGGNSSDQYGAWNQQQQQGGGYSNMVASNSSTDQHQQVNPSANQSNPAINTTTSSTSTSDNQQNGYQQTPSAGQQGGNQDNQQQQQQQQDQSQVQPTADNWDEDTQKMWYDWYAQYYGHEYATQAIAAYTAQFESEKTA